MDLNFTSYRCNGKDIGPTKVKCLLKIYQNSEYKRSAGACPCAIFTKFGGARILPAARAAKNVEVFCLSVCLSPDGVKLGMELTFCPLLHANASRLQGEKPQNRPPSNLYTGTLRCSQWCR